MHTLRCFVAVVFVLVWYFSAFGQLWTQAIFFFLSFFSFFFKNQERETSTQTDDLTEETTRQTKKESNDEQDAGTGQNLPQTKQYPNVQRSLLQVFKCAYAYLVQPWYTAPEPGDSQPLHRALQNEFNLVVEKIICKAKNFDLSATSVGCVRILTQHLHHAKQSDSSPVFGTRYEEMEFLRTFSEALVRNFFPEYLWQPKLYQCFLTEIVATKVLDLLVTNLCNPDNLNQMVVLQLDRVTPKSSVGDLLNSDREGTPSSTASEGAEVLTDDTEDGRSEETGEKKKGNRIKEKFSKFVDKVKSKQAKKKKLKKKEQDLLQRALTARRPAVIEDDGGSSRECSIRSNIDTDNDSDMDVCPTSFQVQEDRMEFKLSYEMWRVGKWAVQVRNVQKENDELCFMVHLEERNNPENLQWDVRKTQSEILHFHSLWQDTSALPSISTIVEKSNRELDDAYTEEVRSALEQFLQELVSDAQLSHSQPVFQFLCPLARLLSEEEDDGGVWGLLSGLANFLTPGQDEEESHNLRREDKLDEARAPVNHATPNPARLACTDTTEELDGGIMEDATAVNFRFWTPQESELQVQDSKQISDEPDGVLEGQENLAESLDIFVNRSKLISPVVHSSDVPNLTSNRNEDLQADTTDGFRRKKEQLTHKKTNSLPKLKGKEKTGETASLPQVQKKELNQTNWEQLEATKAIFDLLKEITGNSFLINIFVDAILKPFMPLLKKKVNNFLNKMNPTEAHIASYIDNFRDRIWPNGNMPLRPPRDSEEKLETKERALQLLSSTYSKSLILKKGDVETVFKIFQDTDGNKKLLYRLLKYVLRELLPGEPAFNTTTNVTVNDFVS
ncbi:uncharacterized protein si:rp71-46j2.7 isoform X2 [Triplophysa dalaica]|uniref:uncharacterized protein si:rp71-46j2.7 isoform X2 n=1 Tax=Triplophysa dalaica TaxID=1582913 RepID=UPI0024DF4D55|nr:uncharacterized protein si:rp71-46j2.7 isoform X2 [Triplophysa dalaica]